MGMKEDEQGNAGVGLSLVPLVKEEEVGRRVDGGVVRSGEW